MSKPYTVGHTTRVLTTLESGIHRPCKRRRFHTEAEAVAFIDAIKVVNPGEVNQGLFFLDGPDVKKSRSK